MSEMHLYDIVNKLGRNRVVLCVLLCVSVGTHRSSCCSVDEMSWGMYIRDDCSLQGVMVQQRPQS